VKHRSGFHNGEPVKTSMVGLCEQLAKLGIWTRLHYVYPYPHVDDVIPLAEGKILPYRRHPAAARQSAYPEADEASWLR
jgi:ribosomal protein S12 methylthiotransferase